MKEFPGEVYDLQCPECDAPLKLLLSREGKPFYGCTRFFSDGCKGSHGARSDGSPYGTPATAATKQWRVRAHSLFNQLWFPKGLHPALASFVEDHDDDRQTAYRWLCQVMDMTFEEGHISDFNQKQCKKLIGFLNDLGLKEEDDPNLYQTLLGYQIKYGLQQLEDFDPLLDPFWVEDESGKKAWCINLEGPEFPECHGKICGEVFFPGESFSQFIPVKNLHKLPANP